MEKLKSTDVKYGNDKKWFDKECKIANLKVRDPTNLEIRGEFLLILSECMSLLRQKSYKNEKPDQLSNTDVHLQNF